MKKVTLTILLIAMLILTCFAFTSCGKEYTIMWQNWDGVVLEVDYDVEKGTLPTYDGMTPTKEGTDQYAYEFCGWDKTVSAATGDTIYIAQFKEILLSYPIVWKNWDGTVLQESNENYGVTPTYTGATPIKESTTEYTYTFIGWAPTIDIVTGGATYIAQFTSEIRTYSITWQNWNGEILAVDKFTYGAYPTYNGDTPKRQGDAEFSYVFTGWSNFSNSVTADATYTAEFYTYKNQYTVTWADWDGTVLGNSSCEYGTVPEFPYWLTEPYRPADEQYTYTFAGWSPTIDAVTNDITYIAQYTSELQHYTVKWTNWNGTLLETDLNVEYGTMPTYNGEAPVRDPSSSTVYVFIGWSPSVDVVTADVTYRAQFTSETAKYTITWTNWDGTVLEVDEDVPYGTTPTYDGVPPTKSSNPQYSYTFDSWYPYVSTVSNDVTYIARYVQTLNTYTVTWKNWDDSVLKIDEVAYGYTPSYSSETPFKEGDVQYSFDFVGWDKEIVEVTEDVIYVAQFEKVINKYKVTWKNHDGTILKEEYFAYGTLPSYNGIPTREDERFYYFTFNSWTPEISVITEDATYTAVYDSFEFEHYTITYISNSSIFATATKEKGGTITIPSYVPTLSGYDFVGWNNIYENTVYQPGDSCSLDGSIRFVAMWKEHCHTCDGNAYVKEQVDCDRCSSSVNGTYVEGMRCPNCNIDYGFYVINGIGNVCESCFYRYGVIYTGYHITCSKCNGRGNVYVDVDCTSCDASGYELPSAPTVESLSAREIVLNAVEGYEYSIDGIHFQSSPVFAGLKPNTTYRFYQRQKTIGKVPFGVTSYALTVTTQDSDIYYITYNLNGGENHSNNIDHYFANYSFQFYTPVKEGFDFVGWRCGGSYVKEIDKTFNTDIELEAVWKAHDYLLSFDLDGGSFPSPQEISVTYVTAYGSTVKTYAIGETVKEWAPTGYGVFLGWYLEADYVTRYDFSTPLTDGMVLYAKYHTFEHPYHNTDEIYYNVTSRGYTCYTSETFYFAVTSTCTIRFGGTNNSGRIYLSNITTNQLLINTTLSYGSTKSITIVGTPENPQIIAVALYLTDGKSNMVFSTSGVWDNSTVASASFTCLEQKEIPNPTKPGYTFAGWTGSNGDTPQTNLKTPVENLCDWSLKANWVRYTIEYVLNGGSATNPTTYTTESDDIVLSAPERVGYTFVGWISSDISEPTKEVVIPSGSTGDRVYTAVWNDGNTYLIALDPNCSDVSTNSIEVQYDHAYSLPTLERDHHIFIGWYNGDTKMPNEGIWTYSLDKLVAKWAYELIDGVLTNAHPELTDLVIPEGVTEIGKEAFKNCKNLASVTIPNSVTSIGDYAFYYCTGLTSVTIPDSVTSIGDRAFYSCTSLSSVTMGSGIQGIGNYAFYRCSGLTSVTLPDSVTSIGDYAFYYCTGLTSVTLPDSVTNVGDCAFFRCTAVTSVTVGNGVKRIGSDAFYDCTALEEIHFYATAMNDLYDGNSVFYNAGKNGNGIKVIVGANVTKIPDYLFYPSSSNSSNSPKVASVTFEEGSVCESIGSHAFTDCIGLTSIMLPNRITSIGGYAFVGCSALTSVTIPDSVTSIGRNAFAGCSSLTSATIPDGVTSIAPYIFYGCKKLTSVTIPDGITSIGEYAFYECSSLESVTIPDGVTSIGYYAFRSCSRLTSIEIPGSVTSIGMDAFAACTGLTSLVIENGVKTIGDYAFHYCTSLKSATIPDSVTYIGEYAFNYCSNLTIYCEAASRPSNWHRDWNNSSCPVVWGYKENN